MDWDKKYRQIVEELGLNPEKDLEATQVLDKLVPEPDLNALQKLIKDRSVLVFGAGPSLGQDIKALKSNDLLGEFTIIAADKPVKTLLEEGIQPDIVVTDLDGELESLVEANRQGALTLIHGHGDNIPLVREWVPKFLGGVLGTTQTEPTEKVLNFGGFTDGDRAVHLAVHFKAKLIVLAGMDYSTHKNQRKLDIGRKLIEELALESRQTILNITTDGTPIKNVPKISVESLSELM